MRNGFSRTVLAVLATATLALGCCSSPSATGTAGGSGGVSKGATQESASKTPRKAAGTGTSNSLIAFSANLKSKEAVHRDAREGLDLFVGEFDPATHSITSVRLVDGTRGAQWFPNFSPDGSQLVYNTTDGRENDVSIVDLASMTSKQLVGRGARFPDFTADGTAVVYSEQPAGTLQEVNVKTRRVTALSTSTQASDPSVAGERYITYHVVVQGVGARPAVFDRQTGTEHQFDVSRGGHPAANPSGTKIALGLVGTTNLYVSTLRGGEWSEFESVVKDVRTVLANKEPEFTASDPMMLAYGCWASDDVMLVTVMPAAGSGRNMKTTAAKLFAVDLSGPSATFAPVTFDDFESAPFSIQSLSCDVLQGVGMGGVGGEAFQLQPSRRK